MKMTELKLPNWKAGNWNFKEVNALQDGIIKAVNAVYAEKDARIDYLEKQNTQLIKELSEKMQYQRIVYKKRG